jgi:1-acyl-sn-glycerol-3-phosphate acyltransferase
VIRQSLPSLIGAETRRLAARALVSRRLDLHVEGLEHVPRQGPILLAARHYHHLYDACAILASVPREVHVMVAVDWLSGPSLSIMNALTRAAQWPAVRRGAPWATANRAAYRLSLDLLRAGRVVLMFPEGYPVVDPLGSRRRLETDFLPFDSGFLRLAERVGERVSIVPVGLWYAPTVRCAWLRFGPPVAGPAGRADRSRVLAEVENAVRVLSAPALL